MTTNKQNNDKTSDDSDLSMSAGSRSEMVNRIEKILECVKKHPHDEYCLEVNLYGADLDEDEDGEYPPELGDMVLIDGAEFSTHEDAGNTEIHRIDLNDFREIISENTKDNHE